MLLVLPIHSQWGMSRAAWLHPQDTSGVSYPSCLKTHAMRHGAITEHRRRALNFTALSPAQAISPAQDDFAGNDLSRGVLLFCGGSAPSDPRSALVFRAPGR